MTAMNPHHALKIPIETHSTKVQANGWVETGDWHTAMFLHPQPAGVKGCPCGRSQKSVQDAILDLVTRTNAESATCLIPGDLTAVRHNGQPTTA
jgi:hypothetical protein